MYSTHTKEKSVVAERFIRTLKKKICKYVTSKNRYIDKLDNIVNKYNNAYHSIIKTQPADVKLSTYTDFAKENNKEAAKFKVGDNVRISKYKNILQKVTFQIGLKKFL